MRTKKTPKFLTTFALLALGISAVASADDLLPPTWRGQPLSVEAHWEFDYLGAPPVPMPADVFSTGGPKAGEVLHAQQAVATIFNTTNMTYDPTLNGPLDGGWVAGPADGFIDFNLPNWIDLEPLKRVYIQLSYVNLGGNTPPSVELIEAFDLVAFPGTSYQGFPAGGGVIDDNHLFDNWLIQPNPDWEIIKVRVPANMGLFETVIDTISIPEPSAAVLLGIGLIMLMTTGRRRH